uniref:Scavenger receptor class B member 1 n=1 Tax=Ornithodoros turicata TaxID=34597 RepID=A0A2R5LJG4_9ACAR
MFSSKILIAATVVGVLLAVLGTLGVILVPSFFYEEVQKKLPLLNGTEAFNIWEDIPLPIYQRYYFFNLTNPEEFYWNGSKPVLKEVGPYSYRCTWVKNNVSWGANHTVSYREVKTAYFDPDASVGNEDDVITTLNMPLIAAGEMAKEASAFKRILITMAVNALKEKLIIQKTVGQLLFQGYHDALAMLAYKMDHSLPYSDGKFGWMHKKNATDDGNFTVFTGEDSMDKYNVIADWNGKPGLSWWKDECNMINGTNGELVPPYVGSRSALYVFNTAFCRSWTLEQNGTVPSHGLNLQRFTAPATTFQNASDYPPNGCFATRRNLRSGVMDISKCQHGAPVLLSFPHFYLGDPSYLEAIEGLHPDPFHHSFNLDVYPELGLGMRLYGRLQINVALEKVPYIRGLENVTEMVYPILWEEINIEPSDAFVDHLKGELQLPLFYMLMAGYLLLGIGTGMVLAVFGIVLGRHLGWFAHKYEDTSPLIDDEEHGKGDVGHEEKHGDFPTA